MNRTPSFTGKHFVVAGHHFFFNTLANTIDPVSLVAASLLESSRNSHGGCDLCRSDANALDLLPFVQNPYSSSDIKEKLANNIRLLILEITRQCNMRCTYCVDGDAYRFKNDVHRDDMPESTALKGIDFLLKHSGSQQRPLAVSFYGGEPLLRFPLIEKVIAYVEMQAGKDIVFSVTTNGTLLNGDYIDFFAEKKVQLIVSIDGPKNVNDQYRLTQDGEGSFDSIMEHLLDIKTRHRTYFDQLVKCSIVIPPGISLPETQQFFHSLGASLIVNFAESYGLDYSKFDGNEIVGFDELYAALGRHLHEKGLAFLDSDEARYDFFLSLFKPLLSRFIDSKPVSRHMPLGQCIPGISRLFVSIDGTLYPCEKTAGHSISRIGSIDQGINVGRVRFLIENFYEIAAKHCDGCWMSGFCTACITHLCTGQELNEQKFSHFCEGAKKWGERVLKLLATVPKTKSSS